MLNTTHPFTSGLIEEIEIVFEIPDHKNGFSATDPLNIPVDAEMLTSYGIDHIRSIAMFYGQPKIINDNLEPPIVNKALEKQYKVHKLVILNKQAFNLSLAEQKLKNKQKSKQTLVSVLSKQKLIKINKNIKTYQRDIEELKKS